ncbi:hypothetical protein TIFTF001_029662 [Ficus carica]|uniref:Uncharacterized protein n=1 Tax=Ficus carica TaxID=3494 RepID=A0AA88DS78_FICCA|nr:hypothetical protein TIFTF001_029662 [Ficus carica]
MTKARVHGLGRSSQHGLDRWASFAELRPAWLGQGRGAWPSRCADAGRDQKQSNVRGTLVGVKYAQVGRAVTSMIEIFGDKGCETQARGP